MQLKQRIKEALEPINEVSKEMPWKLLGIIALGFFIMGSIEAYKRLSVPKPEVCVFPKPKVFHVYFVYLNGYGTIDVTASRDISTLSDLEILKQQIQKGMIGGDTNSVVIVHWQELK